MEELKQIRNKMPKRYQREYLDMYRRGWGNAKITTLKEVQDILDNIGKVSSSCDAQVRLLIQTRFYTELMGLDQKFTYEFSNLLWLEFQLELIKQGELLKVNKTEVVLFYLYSQFIDGKVKKYQLLRYITAPCENKELYDRYKANWNTIKGQKQIGVLSRELQQEFNALSLSLSTVDIAKLVENKFTTDELNQFFIEYETLMTREQKKGLVAILSKVKLRKNYILYLSEEQKKANAQRYFRQLKEHRLSMIDKGEFLREYREYLSEEEVISLLNDILRDK